MSMLRSKEGASALLEVGENTNEADFMIVKHLHGIRAILHTAFDTEDAVAAASDAASAAPIRF